MPNIKEVLKEFVATANAGQYATENELLSKFPELSGYDANTLKEFVSTANAGQYESEDDLLSKFPEFGKPVKKKEESSVPLWLQKQEQPKQKPEPTLPFLESKPSGISLGSQRVPETAPMFEAPPMRTPEEAQAIVETPEYKETPYFTGTFGDILKNVDNPLSPTSWLGIGDAIDDFGRAVAQGASTGDVIGPTSKIFLNGDKVSDKTIEDFRKASEMAERLGPSDEMVSFSNQYQESGKTTAGFLKALAMNPGAIPEIMVSSYTAMVNAPSLQAAGGVISTSAAGGAVVGGPAGAGAAALASVPYAMAAMGATLETNASLAESIKEKLAKDGLEWSDESIRKVISDKDFLNDARLKAATRGVTIGAIDALTGRIAGKVGAKLLKAPKAGVAKSAAAAGSIEAVGGSVGEATARGLTGEEMDVAEIGLEGIAELPGTVVSVGAEVLKTPVYKINGEIRPESDVQGIINTATGDDLSKINIEIINDKKGYKQQIQDKVVSSQVKKEVKEVNPELPEETIDEIVSLEMERKKFEGKKTQSAKDKLASINSKIKTLQENAVQKPSTEEGVLRPEDPQVGLQEVGEGDAKEQAPTQEVVKEEVVTAEPKAAPPTDEDLQAAFDRLEMPEDVETLPGIDDELNKINESIGRVKEEGNTRDDERTLMDLGDKIARAKKNVASAEDTEAAIDELRQAQKERDDFEQSIEKRKNFNTVTNLIADEIESSKDTRFPYEYQELFDQDPRLAALQSTKDMIAFAKENNRGEDRVKTYENNIKILEEDIAKFPVKEAVSPATPKVQETPAIEVRDEQGNLVEEIRPQPIEVRDEDGNLISTTAAATPKAKPKVSSKTPKAKSVPIPVAIPKPTPRPVPTPTEDIESIVDRASEDDLEDVEETYMDFENTFRPRLWFKRVGDSLFSKSKGLPEKYTKEFLISKGIDPEQHLKEWAQFGIDNQKKIIAEAYRRFKGSGMHTEFVDAVDKLISNTIAEQPIKEATPVVKEQAVATPKVAKTKAVAPVKEEVAPVKEAAPAPTTKAVGPEALRQEYIDKTAEVRLNKDTSRTPKQIEERIAELKAEYQKLKAEMTAPKPKTKVEAKPKAKVEEEAPLYDEVKDIDPNDETGLKKLLNFLDNTDASLSEFGRGNLSSGMAVPLARAIIKSLKVLVKAGITLQEAIKRVAAENNLEAKDIVNMIKELDSAQSPMVKLRNQIRAEVQSGIAAKKDLNQKRKDLSNLIKSMEVTGKISSAKARAVLNKIGKLNMDNSVAVDEFVDYVTNVFENAEYVENLSEINSKLQKAKKNIKSKIGTAKNLGPLLNRLFAINPKLVPVEVFDSYSEIVDMFGASGALLDLENINDVTEKVNSVLDFVDDYMSVIPELADKLFNYSKGVLTDEGALDYSATIEKMKSDNTITEEEYVIMKKYKSYIMPKVKTIPKTEKELAEEKKELLKQIKDINVNTSQLTDSIEIDNAKDLIKLAKSPVAELLSNRELSQLIKVLENINNGYYHHISNNIFESLKAARNSVLLDKGVQKAKIPTLEELAKRYNKTKIANLINKIGIQRDRKEAIASSIKRVLTFNIDEVFGDFKTKDIFNAIFNDIAVNQQAYEIERRDMFKKMSKIKEDLLKHYKGNANDAKKAEMKMFAYSMQKQYESNPNNPLLPPAVESIEATIDAGNKTMYRSDDIKVLKDILENYGVKNEKGEIVNLDLDAMEKSFSPLERSLLSDIRNTIYSYEDKVLFTSNDIRGNKVYMYNDYVPLSVLNTKKENPDSISELVKKFNANQLSSTKAGSLMERTPGAKPVNFNLFNTVERSLNQILMDYYLTSPIRVARGTIKRTTDRLKKEGKLTEEKKDVLNSIEEAFELSVKSILDQNMVADSFAEEVVKEIAKAGYKAMLTGIPRSASDFTGNLLYALIGGRKDFVQGMKFDKVVSGPNAVAIMINAKSKNVTRSYGDTETSGKLADPAIMSKNIGVSESTLRSPIGNTASMIYNATLQKGKNATEYVAEKLSSFSDRIIVRYLWFGSFSNSFKDITGIQLTDKQLKEISNKNSEFYIENKDAIEAAGRIADEKATMAGNVDNPFMSALRGYIPSDDGSIKKAMKIFDNFMIRFVVGDFLVSRKAVMAMMGNGSISRGQGVKLMAAVVTRMTVYTIMLNTLQDFVYGLFTGDDDEEDDKSLAKKFGQGVASTLTTLVLGRDYGNISRTMINYGVEKANEEYLDFLREGEYDAYEDAIQYNFLSSKDGKALEGLDILASVTGPMGPSIKTLGMALKATGPDKKEAAASERQQRERWQRLPLEVFGNLGYVPLYKDIRNILNKDIYKDVRKELGKTEEKEEFKPMGLGREDLKRYYPEIYEQYYGEGTEYSAKRKLKSEQDRLEREIKDEYYNYTPKKKQSDGFGGKGFGTGTGKKSGGFGSKGFGK